MRVAPRGFGRFGGRLIMPDELSGNVYATSAKGDHSSAHQRGHPGRSRTLASRASDSFRPGSIPAVSRHTFPVLISLAISDWGTQAILSLGPSALRRVTSAPEICWPPVKKGVQPPLSAARRSALLGQSPRLRQPPMSRGTLSFAPTP